MIPLPPRVSPGQPVLAKQYNALLDFCAALLKSFESIRGGDGILVDRSGLGDGSPAISTVISLASRPDILRLGRIAAVAGVDGSGIGTIGSINYDVRVMREPQMALLEGVVPEGVRPTQEAGVEFLAAEVGDPCLVWRRSDGEGSYEQVVVVLTESDAPMVACDA